MKAAVFYQKEDLRIEELSIPTPGEKEVLIRVRACGICGTDMHIFDGDGIATDKAKAVVHVYVACSYRFDFIAL